MKIPTYVRWMRSVTFLFVVGCTLLIKIIHAQTSENYTIKKWVLTEGGNLSSSASYTLQDACGQPLAVGIMTSENYGITSGFFGEGEVGTAIEDNNEEDTDVPRRLFLHQNYPNPFNPRTSIAFDLPWKAEVRLVVYDLQRKEINQLLQGTQSAGHYTVIWNGEDYAGRTVSSGVYFYRMMVRHLDSESETIVKAGKMIFMK